MECTLIVVEPSFFEVTAKGCDFVPFAPLVDTTEPKIPPAGAGAPNVPPVLAGAPKGLPVEVVPNGLFVATNALDVGAPK